MHTRESIWDVILFSESMLDSIGKGYKKVLPSPELLAVWCSFYESTQGFVIGQDYKLVSFQLGFKKV